MSFSYLKDKPISEHKRMLHDLHCKGNNPACCDIPTQYEHNFVNMICTMHSSQSSFWFFKIDVTPIEVCLSVKGLYIFLFLGSSASCCNSMKSICSRSQARNQAFRREPPIIIINMLPRLETSKNKASNFLLLVINLMYTIITDSKSGLNSLLHLLSLFVESSMKCV